MSSPLLKSWNDISDKYNEPNLFLGNGFSINIFNGFNYTSLFDEFLLNCNDSYKILFSQFNTTNFELILKHLNYTRKVNVILELGGVEIIDEAIEALKKGLIKTIEQIHPRSKDISLFDKNYLETLAKQFNKFGNIFTTNYDLFLYQIIMKIRDLNISDSKYIIYNDNFSKPGDDVLYFERPKSNSSYKNKSIYYLHGALFIFNDDSFAYKIRRYKDVELIEVVASKIQSGNIPLFVSEGDPKDKERTIYSNRYLDYCLEKLREDVTPLIMFGYSLSEFDEHIIEILKNYPREIIISIYRGYLGDRSRYSIDKEIYEIKEKFSRDDIQFIDSASVFPEKIQAF